MFDNYVIMYLVDRKGVVRETSFDIRRFKKINKYKGTFFASYRKKIQGYYCCISSYLGIKNEKPQYKTEYLHRIIAEISDRKVRVDHFDYNTLNNKDSNLRLSNASTNSTHRCRKNSNNTSGYRNVIMKDKHWRVQLQIDGKNKLFPQKFDDVELAGKFAKRMRKKYYKDFSGK